MIAAGAPVPSASPAAPGDGPLFGTDSLFAPAALAPHLGARESARFHKVLATIEARGVERGSGNPPLRAGFAALGTEDRERLLLDPDFRRLVARLLRSLDQDPPEAILTAQVQATWNQLAIPWLRGQEDTQFAIWLQVYGDGTVPLPGSGLALTSRVSGRRARMIGEGEELRFVADSGEVLVVVSRRELLRAAEGNGAAPRGFTASPRLPGTVIEVTGGGDPEVDQALAVASSRLQAAWPSGHALISGLVHRLVIDPNPDLNSKTESELPGVIFLGRHRTDPMGIAELLVHEAAHLLVYEIANLAPVIPAPHEISRSPFSREENRPAYMVLHATTSFLAQAIATLRLAADPAQVMDILAIELARLNKGERELRTHLDAHGAQPHPFVGALFGELALLAHALRGN